ncbi:MAG: ABC transporter ATP-binding protein, partial [bacterium]
MITFNDVDKNFACGSNRDMLFNPLEVEALSGIDFEHPNGVTLHLSGPAGAGKSVILNLIAGLYPPDHGQIRVNKHDPYQSIEFKKNIALVRYSPGQFDGELSARDNLNLLGGWYCLGESERENRVEEVLQFVGLENEARSVALGELSAGTVSRIALAGGLLPSPEFLLLDDPARYLGESGIARVNKLLNALEERGMTLVIASKRKEICAGLNLRRLQLDEG